MATKNYKLDKKLIMSKHALDKTALLLINWIDSNKQQFSHLNGFTSEDKLMLLKPIGELALCCDLMIRSNLQQEWAKNYLTWAWNELEKGDFLKKTVLARPSLIMICSLYSTFHRNGFHNAGLLDLLRYHVKSSFTEAMQYPYWRRLDLMLAFYEIGLSDKLNPIFENTWSFHQPEPWMIDNESAYALTHEVFYITNFGESVNLIPKISSEYIKRWLPTWRKIFLQDDNFDIYAELIMTSACIGGDSRLSSDYELIEREVNEFGFLRGPEHGGRSLSEGVTSDKRITFLKNYHTTLVGMMALCLYKRLITKN